MGHILANTTKDKAKVKLDYEKVRDFSRADEEWQKWINRTLCAFSGTGYKEVIIDREHANRHPEDNEIVFSRLSAATTDGIAYHLVQKFEDMEPGSTFVNGTMELPSKVKRQKTYVSNWRTLPFIQASKELIM